MTMQHLRWGSSDGTKPDPAPKSINVGVANPYALAEAILGRPIDRKSPTAQLIVSDVLQTSYDELFDMRYNSVLYAGLKLNPKENQAERIKAEDMRQLNEDDLITPDMSRIEKISDLEHVGLKDVLETKVQNAYISNGKLKLILMPHALGRTLSNSAVTHTLMETFTPFRKEGKGWTPPNATWENVSQLSLTIQRKRMARGFLHMSGGMRSPYFMSSLSLQKEMEQDMIQMAQFNDPVQGAVPNSWLIAALFAVAWSEPSRITRDNAFLLDSPDEKHEKRTLSIKLHSKGGENDAPTANVEVNFDIPVNNSSNLPIYCRSSNGIGAVWPSLYEKAFAKWLVKGSSDHPDITQTAASANGGDPVKAMAQINDREPKYYYTHSRTGADLLGLVRANCVNWKTIHPMTAFTHASGNVYKGSTIVANHAYTVLGWALSQGNRNYVVLRNPWGVTEPLGMTTYPGLLEVVDRDIWPPLDLLDRQGVFALEAHAFKEYFACLGMTK